MTDRNNKAVVLLARAIMNDLKRLFPFQDYWMRDLRLLAQLSSAFGIRRNVVEQLDKTMDSIRESQPASPLELKRGDKFHKHVISSINDVTRCLSDICVRMSHAHDVDDAHDVAKTTADIDRYYFGPESKKYASDLVNLAMITLQIGDLDEAQGLCDEAIKVDNLYADEKEYEFDRGQSHMMAAEILLQKGDDDGARQHAREAIKLLMTGNIEDYHGL